MFNNLLKLGLCDSREAAPRKKNKTIAESARKQELYILNGKAKTKEHHDKIFELADSAHYQEKAEQALKTRLDTLNNSLKNSQALVEQYKERILSFDTCNDSKTDETNFEMKEILEKKIKLLLDGLPSQVADIEFAQKRFDMCLATKKRINLSIDELKSEIEGKECSTDQS